MNGHDCPMVADLLPSYVEHLTSTETNALIAQHLATCESCQALLADYTAEIRLPAALPTALPKKDKKEKRHVLRLRLELLWYLFWPLLYGAMNQWGHPGTLDFFITMLGVFGFVFILSHNMEYNFDLDDSKKAFYDQEQPYIRAGKGTFLARGLIWLLPILLPIVLMLIPLLVP